jgi:hypothetical protein
MAYVWLVAKTIDYVDGGGHFWVYLNWALGLVANGCRVTWVELAPEGQSVALTLERAATIRKRLASFGLSEVFICEKDGCPIPGDAKSRDLLGGAATADLLLDLSYSAPATLLEMFRRSAMIDIDPGLTQLWLASGQMSVATYDTHFTIGETVGTPEARFPDCGVRWRYTPPCISLEHWPVSRVSKTAPYTTISHWWREPPEWVHFGNDSYDNSKRAGFAPYLKLPCHTPVSLELALSLGGDETELPALKGLGWRVREARDVASRPETYRTYVQASRGEFSCVKPSCVRLQNAWISDRTLCYLASGKPAIIEHTGPSRMLPEAKGLLRFRSFDEAIDVLAEAEAHYDAHAREARGLAEDLFDARKVAGRVLEAALSPDAAAGAVR